MENIDINLFNKKNLDTVVDKVEQHINKLLDIEEYMELSRKLSKLSLEITSNPHLKHVQAFRNYQEIELKLLAYHSTLAYYLGKNDKIK